MPHLAAESKVQTFAANSVATDAYQAARRSA